MIFDLHCHTRFGSACSYMTPEEMVQRAARVGLDGVCITEHDIPWDREAARRLSDRFGILVVGGMEISTTVGEVLVYGLHEPVFDVQNIADLRRRVNRFEGFMVAAHPFRGAASLMRYASGQGVVLKTEEALRMPVFDFVDAMEVFNGMSPQWEIDLCSRVCDLLPIQGTGGSDCHNVRSVGGCVTVLNDRVSTEEGFIAQMRSGRYHAFHRLLNLRHPGNGEEKATPGRQPDAR